LGELRHKLIEHEPVALVLGIDAAWTERGSSGLALLRVDERQRTVLAVAPSYAGFIALAEGRPVDWGNPPGGVPVVSDLLAAAVTLGGQSVDVVAMDMPLSRRPINGRRPADQAVSRSFGAFGAAVHSQSANRPDKAVTGIVRDLEAAGYEIATMIRRVPALIEVYPLAALVRLLRVGKRPEYKVSKIARYGWPKPLDERIERLLRNWSVIRGALEREVGTLGINFPAHSKSAAKLKPYEDAIDAVVSAWVGSRFLDGKATAYPGDDPDAAIWIPDQL
jgi:predicted RNase H-like nuclease